VNDTNVVTGATRNYGDWSGRTFTLSPDGTAAVFVPVSGQGAGSPQYLDLTTGARTPLPGANGFGSTAWGPGGWLFYSSNDGRGLAAWHPGLRAPRIMVGVESVLTSPAAL
jgi:hypothetical protein